MRILTRVLPACLAAALVFISASCNKKTPVSDVSTAETTAASAAPAEYTSQAKVLCYNVYYQDVGRRQSDIIDFIKSVDADVMGLQEVTSEWRPYINAGLVDTGQYAAFGYNRMGVAWEDMEKAPGDKEFNVILYKTDKYELVKKGHFWISTTPNVYSAQIEGGIISQTPRCINWVLLKDKSTGGEFVFLNAHLDAYSTPVQNFSTKLITEQMKPYVQKYPVVLVGDWNSQPSSTAIRYFIDNGYENARYIAEETTSLGTYQAFGSLKENEWKAGDIILVNKDKSYVKKFDVLLAMKNGEHLSDHNPLVMEMHY